MSTDVTRAPDERRQSSVPAAHAARGSSIAMFVALTAIAGGADFALFPSRWPSMVAAGMLALVAVVWPLLLLRGRPAGPVGRGRGWGLFAFQVLTALLALAFTVAKLGVLWSTLQGGTALVGAYRTYAAAVVLLVLFASATRAGRVARLIVLSADHPARLMAGSFGIAALIGALLLALPVCLTDVSKVSLVDAFFMSTSALCVTGLATLNVAESYTLTGQVVLCLLMQIGGLGIMALTAAVTLLAGRRLGVKSSAVLAEMVDATSLVDLKRTLRAIVVYTLLFEAIGAVLLYLQFRNLPEIAQPTSAPGPLVGAGSALWAAVFHSVSAFCNGSLSNFRGGLVPFAGSPGVCQTLSALIILGGLGFPVIHELALRALSKLRGQRPHRMSLNTRVALVTSAALFVAVSLAYLALESGASFRDLSLVDRVNAATFQSACARTSGFNVVDVAAMRPATLLLTCFAMFVGADPGSTAGGIKTTTLAVLFASYRGELRGQRPRLFDRTVPEAIVRRAVGVAFLSTLLISAVVFLLSLVEPSDTLSLFFETTSAFSTTGLSMGITPSLSVTGKLLIASTMLLGRVGPLTVALALSARGRAAAIELPEERVMIG